MNHLKQIQLLLLACTISVSTIAGRWENYSNFSQITDVQPSGFQSIVTAKGGVLIVNQLTAEKKFYTISNSALPSSNS